MDFEAEGIWGHIVSCAPPVEVAEIAKQIGTQHIKKNSDLWRELKAFSSILSDLHTMDLFDDRGNLTFFSHNNNKGGDWAPLTEAGLKNNADAGTSKVPSLDFGMGKTGHSSSRVGTANNSTGRRSNETNQQGSNIAGVNVNVSTGRSYATGTGTGTGRSTESMDSLEFIQSIEGCINVTRISEVKEEIRRALTAERSDLQAEISVLEQALDGESDVIAARSATSRRQEEEKEKETADTNNAKSKSKHTHRKGTSKIGRFRRHIEVGALTCSECRSLNLEFEPGKIKPCKSVKGVKSKVKDVILCAVCLEKEEKEVIAEAEAVVVEMRRKEKYDSVMNHSAATISRNRNNGNSNNSNINGNGNSSRALVEGMTEGYSTSTGGPISGPSGPGGRGGGRSGIRNKLQAARDEKHFLDFDL